MHCRVLCKYLTHEWTVESGTYIFFYPIDSFEVRRELYARNLLLNVVRVPVYFLDIAELVVIHRLTQLVCSPFSAAPAILASENSQVKEMGLFES